MQVQVTRNFSRNLVEIEEFLCEDDADDTFDALLDDLFENVIPTLEQQPDLGRDFLLRHVSTKESALLAARFQQRLGTEGRLRELIQGNSILLYARQPHALFLLSIKHYRQLSFDFLDRWND